MELKVDNTWIEIYKSIRNVYPTLYVIFNNTFLTKPQVVTLINYTGNDSRRNGNFLHVDTVKLNDNSIKLLHQNTTRAFYF